MKNQSQDRTDKQEPGSKSSAASTSRQGVTGEELTRTIAGNVIQKQQLTPGAAGTQSTQGAQPTRADDAQPPQREDGKPSRGAESTQGAQSKERAQSAQGAEQSQGAQSSQGTQPTRFEAIQLAAYLRAERRGFSPGYEMEDWLAAEREIAEREGAGTVG
jgi:hypothetical protein